MARAVGSEDPRAGEADGMSPPPGRKKDGPLGGKARSAKGAQ